MSANECAMFGGLRTWIRASCVVATLAMACDTKTAADPFPNVRPAPPRTDTGGNDSGADPVFIDDDQGPVGSPLDPTLGGRCLDDDQCDDGIECTFDSCDLSVRRCRFRPDDARCQDGLYCNGSEVCSPGLGCRRGEPVSCADQNPCTIDRCIEEGQSCERKLRDVDGDGDPDAHCVDEGGDCNDQDATVSSAHSEICDNGKDDDCDGVVDEPDCRRPQHDGCADALVVDGPGSFQISLEAAGVDAASSCSEPGAPDVFVEVAVAEASDVLVSMASERSAFSAAWFAACEDAAEEIACSVSQRASSGGGDRLRLLLRGAEAGRYWLALFGADRTRLELEVEFLPASTPPRNESCEGAARLSAGNPQLVDLDGALADHESACGSGLGELVYEFELDDPSDVRLFAVARDAASEAMLSLRSEACAALRDELACSVRGDAGLFRRGLPPGRYFVAVAAALGGRHELTLLVEPTATSPAGESCTDPLPLPLGRVVDVDLGRYGDALMTSCQPAGRDAILALQLEERSDVLLKQRASAGDRAAVSLLGLACDQQLACTSGTAPPLRAVAHDLVAGEYRVVVESETGSPVQVLALSRPARAPIVVVGADDCDAPQDVPEFGGFFVGNTTDLGRDFTASCDVANAASGGAPDQLLRLEVNEPSLLVLDGLGSSYEAIINLRRGPDCPGREVPLSCASPPDDSAYVEAFVEPGVYYIQIDGFAGAEGQWNLEVFVLPQPQLADSSDD